MSVVRFGPYFVTPVVAGLDDNDHPLVATMDSIGALDSPSSGFVTGGTTADELTGIAENLWREGLVTNLMVYNSEKCVQMLLLYEIALRSRPRKNVIRDTSVHKINVLFF